MDKIQKRRVQMEQIIKKLSEIETTARSIMESADQNRTALSEEAERQCKEFDTALEHETNEQIRQIRENLEKEKDAQLTALRQETEASYTQLDSYYEKNHKRLSEEIFKEIIR